MNTYQFIKRIHLYASMILFVFLLMYIFSGFLLINHNWFLHHDATITENKIPFNCQGLENNSQIIEKIKKYYIITGRTSEGIVKKDNSIQWNIRRPGLEHQIMLSEKKDSITIKRTEQQTFIRILSRLHHLRSYENGALYKAWAFIYDLSAVSFIVFSMTGVYMWFRLRKKYKWGWAFLFVGITIPMSVFFFLI